MLKCRLFRLVRGIREKAELPLRDAAFAKAAVSQSKNEQASAVRTADYNIYVMLTHPNQISATLLLDIIPLKTHACSA